MLGMGFFTQIDVDTAIWIPIVGMAVFDLGFGMAMPTVTDTIMASVSVDDAGVGSAMNDLSRELDFVLGVAILGSLVASLYRNDVTEAIAGLVPESVAETIGNSFGAVGSITSGMPPEVALAVTDSANTSFVDALNFGFIAAAGFVALGILVAATMVPRRSRSTQAESVGESPDQRPDSAEAGVAAATERAPVQADYAN
jgi:hypothetical protein